ncbi:CHAT domain-containing protein [Vararia minispora EC-137]|uniref:CHAT domain-containing protein n=1 Tax=Vararia minispora EC-137 TaxID=1314806 RepID=A0ACB8QTM6_9AGAM|nr:CHAT domain-containing protein [Vararia minispora EC-137]
MGARVSVANSDFEYPEELNQLSYYDNVKDVDEEISSLQRSILIAPDWRASSKAVKLTRLGNAFVNRFELLGQRSDIDSAFSTLQKAMSLLSRHDKSTAIPTGVLGTGYSARFRQLGDPKDLSTSISLLRQAVELSPPNHVCLATLLSSLGGVLMVRFLRYERAEDADEAIPTLQRAVELTPPGHPDLAIWLYNLGTAYTYRFERLGHVADIGHAISVLTQSIDITMDGDASTANQLGSLGVAYRMRFERYGDIKDLESAFATLTRSLNLAPVAHPSRTEALHELGQCYSCRFNLLEEAADIQTAVDLLKRSVDSTPDPDSSKATYLNSLCIAYRRQFRLTGKLEDIDAAVAAARSAIILTPSDDARQIVRLYNCGIAYRERFERRGALEDLEHAVSALQEAVDHSFPGHHFAPVLYSGLGVSLASRFNRLGDFDDINKSIAAHTRAVELTPDDHVDKPSRLNSAGLAFISRFQQSGDLTDVETAVDFLRRTVNLTPVKHADYPSWLCNLGAALKHRFELVDEPEDLQGAIVYMRRGLELTPNDHTSKAARLSLLADTLQRRFERRNTLDDSDEALLLLRRSLELTPVDDYFYRIRLNNLGDTLRIRFSRDRNLTYIQESISTLEEANRLTPDEHSHKVAVLSNLGFAYMERYECLHDPADLIRVLDVTQQALDLTPDEHARKASWLNQLGDAYRIRFEGSSSLSDFDKAVALYEQATVQLSANPNLKFAAACNWIRLCTAYHSPSSLILRAYERTMELIPQVIWLGQNIERRLDIIRDSEFPANGAAAAAIAAGEFTRALEWLESGRSIVWNQVLGLHTPLDDLNSANPALADKLRSISRALERAGTSTRLQIHDVENHAVLPAEDVGRTHRALAREYEGLLSQVRQMEGFEDFLLPKRFDKLVRVAEHGLVVMINVDPSRCDALALRGTHVIPIHLPKFSYDLAAKLRTNLFGCIAAEGARNRASMEAKMCVGPAGAGPWPTSRFGRILSCLWMFVVQPILSAIEEALWEGAVDRIPHITWCATGPLAFLPIHAAGIYGSSAAISVSDIAVSSYVPTLSTLLSASRTVPTSPPPSTMPSGVLVVSQSHTPGQAPLPGTIAEVAAIKQRSSHSVSLLEESHATVDAVLAAMQQHRWVHLACHGEQHNTDPSQSAFLLHDGRLTLGRLMSQSLVHAELAVLSACQTATGDTQLPEEAMHLTAGMLAVGYKSVVGTMWSIGDSDAPVVADEFYAGLEEVGRAGIEPAYALHNAIGRLREEIGVQNFIRWVPFVHFGR